MILGGSAHLAPSGGAGRSAIFGPGWSTCATNEIHLPSGDQFRLAGADVIRVTCAVCPESSHMRQTCVEPSRFDVNATSEPSGDQRASVSVNLPEVSGRSPVPSKLMIQRFE